MNTGLAILIVELLLGASIVHRLLWRLSVYWKEGSLRCNVDSNLSPGIVTIDVSEYGVWCDGIHDDTRLLQNIFRTIIPFKRIRRSDVHVIVIVPQECVVVSGPVTIQSISGLTLQIDGRLQAWDISRNNYSMLGVWPMQEPLITYGNSRDVYGLYYQYQPFIYMNNVSHVRITGNGVVDGFGQPWWDIIASRNESLLHLLSAGRPNLIQIINSSFIEIDTITIQNSPFWTLHPVLSQYIHIHHITISAPLYSPNVDGIDPDSCQHVLIEYVHIECGDDHIAIKAGVCGTSSPNNCTDAVWSSGYYRTENVTVQHSTFGRGMGIAIGSEMSGGIQNVFIYNNTIGLCDTGSEEYGCGWGPALHVKTTLSRGGYIQNVVFHNNRIWNTSMFILLELGYQTSSSELPPIGYRSTMVRNITFSSNIALGSARSATFHCSMYDLCHHIAITDNLILTTGSIDNNPWHCQYIADDFIEARNYPPGLEACLHNSSDIFESTSTDLTWSV